MKKGETFTSKNVRSVRPSIGMHPRHLGEVLGRVATRDIDFATPLAWDMVGVPAEVRAIALRRATTDDANLLLAWRNDPETRQGSLNADEMSVEQQRAVLTRALEGGDRGLYIAEDGGRKIGAVRLDPAGNASLEVSMTVAPDERKKGYGTAMLCAADAEARRLGAVRVIAYVRADNVGGRKAMEHAGYHSFVECTRGDQKVLRCEHRVATYRPSDSPFWGERNF